ncbi:tRNA lysidine(34) synthetase TilS [Sphingosinithalassobacter portus]|uniref:tRNA lysidine(34) synthetase TilS n=1 Tax=Stakelama portus TaxID=2676234 RepID=UPI000D6E7457|nr:tRNA lysidine(34) synthetase TilS [Sphingosinithalassobacter portus]
MSRPASRNYAVSNGTIARPDAARVARFRADLESLTGGAPEPDAPLGLAVSGGSDSMAMLALAAAAWPGAVRAATVDHGLRVEAADEAAMVRAVCDTLKVPHVTLERPADHGFCGNVQQQARALRYRLLADWAIRESVRWVAVAHQRDDVAETFLMRARRGSGVGGMAAILPARAMLDDVADAPLLVRPLLDWSRAELAGVARCAGVPFVEDPSNEDPRYDRSRMRGVIAQCDELPAGRLALAARNLRHAEDAIAWALARELPERIAGEGADLTVDVADLPYELRRRLARHAIDSVRAAGGLTRPWGDQGLDRFAAALDRGDAATLAEVMAHPRGNAWRFRLAPSRRSH